MAVLKASALLAFGAAGINAFPSPLDSRDDDCGPVGQWIQSPKWDQWDAANTSEWLNQWWSDHDQDIHSDKGFIGAFTQYALGGDGWDCSMGSTGVCGEDLCGQDTLNNLPEDDIRPAAYVLLAIQNWHSYYNKLYTAFGSAGIEAALEKDSWSDQFWKEKPDDLGTLEKIFDALTGVLSLGSTIFGGVPGIIGAEVGQAAASVGTAINGLNAGWGTTNSAIRDSWSTASEAKFDQGAKVGQMLGKVVSKSMHSFTGTNDILAKGDTVKDNNDNDRDIRSFFSGGVFLDDRFRAKLNDLTDTATMLLVAKTINYLWDEQKVFIIGGNECGNMDQIGQFNNDGAWSYCDEDNRQWFLYFWKEFGTIAGKHIWGGMDIPPGAKSLGQDDPFKNIDGPKLVESAVKAYKAGGFNYDTDTANSRIQEMLGDFDINLDASFEGLFTIPVCNATWAASPDADVDGKQYILQPYGWTNQLHFCGPICENDAGKTFDFVNAAHMKNFKSPFHNCDTSSQSYQNLKSDSRFDWL